MENINYKAELDISQVLRNMVDMEQSVQKGNSEITKTISSIKLIYENMSSTILNNTSSMSNSMAQISSSTEGTKVALDTLSNSLSSIAKGSEIVTVLSNAFQNTSSFVDTYTQKIVEANIQSGSTMSGFSVLDTVLQGITENMNLASISTSLTNIAMTAMDNPVLFLTEAVAGLVLGLGSLSLMADTNYQTLEKNKQIIESNSSAVQSSVDSYGALQKMYDKQIESDLSLISNNERLYERLTTIVSANGQVKEGYEGVASFILGELNNAFGTNYQVVDGVIQGYDLLASSVDNSVDKMKADAILETQKKNYQEALNSMDEATSMVKKQEDELVRVKQENQEVINNYYEEANKARLADNELSAMYYEKKAEEAKKDIEVQEKAVEDAKDVVQGKVESIALFEDNAAAYAEGRYQDVKTRQDAAIAEDTQSQLEAYQCRYDNLKIQRDAHIANGDETRALEMQKEIDEELVQAQTMLETKGINNEAELASLGTFIGDKQARLTEMYAVDEAQWTEEQRKEAEALKTSIDGGLATYNQFATDKVTKAVELRNSLNENSTEEQKNAAAAAEKEAASTLQIAGQNAIDKLSILQDLKARKANGEAGITDNMIMEAERQAVEAETGYGKVASKIEESWEDLPEESRTTFQNVMQPMVDEMQKKEPTLFEKASGIAGGILERLKKSFDINSPSRKVRKIFESVMEGAEVGLDNHTPELLDQTENISKQVITAFSNITAQDLHGLASKMQSAINAENLQMQGIVNSNLSHELYSTQKVKIEIPEIKGTISGKIENHLEIDGRETAIQLTPFISEELAFSSR